MTNLSSSTDIKTLKKWIATKDQAKIADFVYERFYERYIYPIDQLDADEKHGFSIMAVACLMIEAYESFYNGWGSTKNRSEKAFVNFFNREAEFKDFKPMSSKFYKNVRCGILHQGETTNGWRVIRKGNLLENKTINATIFLKRLNDVLRKYRDYLKVAAWDGERWDNLRRKLRIIIKNCET